MKYASLDHNATLAMQYDALAFAAISQVCNRFLPWTNSSLRPAAIQVALNDIVVNRHRTVLELGSGLSTVFLARMLGQLGGRLVTVDHDAGWLEHVRHWLSPEELAVTTSLHAPLRPEIYKAESVMWYDAAVVTAALRELPRVDLLLIDGPPAYYHERCLNRGPALGTIRPYLAPDATVLLDDINRTGEQHIAGCWSDELGSEYRDLTVEAGVAVWSLGASHNISQ